MKARALFAGRGSQGNSWSWDFSRGGAENQLRTGRRVRWTNDLTQLGTITDADASRDLCLVQWDDGKLQWSKDRELEVVTDEASGK